MLALLLLRVPAWPLAWRLGLLYEPYVPLWEFLAPVAELPADSPEPGEEAA